MALGFSEKQTIVAELTERFETALSVIAADYRGMSVSEMNELRVKSRDAGVSMQVYRNTLARRAVAETAHSCLTEALTGPIVLFFSDKEPGAAARMLRDFVKTHERLQIRGLALDGRLLGPDRLQTVASLPTREEALAQLMATMQAPITQLTRTIQETYVRAARVLAAIRDQKQSIAG